MSAAARRLRRASIRRAADTAAAVSGCICDREIVIHNREHVSVRHDDWCPLADHATQILIYRPQGCDR